MGDKQESNRGRSGSGTPGGTDPPGQYPPIGVSAVIELDGANPGLKTFPLLVGLVESLPAN